MRSDGTNPKCESCCKPFSKHLGIVGTCAALIKAQKERDALIKQRDALADSLWAAEDQWGDDFLWQKRRLSDPLTRALKDELTKKVKP